VNNQKRQAFLLLDQTSVVRFSACIMFFVALDFINHVWGYFLGSEMSFRMSISYLLIEALLGWTIVEARRGNMASSALWLTISGIVGVSLLTLYVGFGLYSPSLPFIGVFAMLVTFISGSQKALMLILYGSVLVLGLAYAQMHYPIMGVSLTEPVPQSHVVLAMLCFFAVIYFFCKAYLSSTELAFENISEQNSALSLLNENLQQAVVEKENALTTQARFLAMMSHEIRTPMSGVSAAMKLLRHPKADEAMKQRSLNAIEASSKNLLNLLNDLLDTAQMEAGAFNILNKPFNLSHVVTETVDLFSIAAQQKGLLLDARCPPEADCEVLGDSARLRQMLSNLLGNAIKFTEKGGVTVRVECETEPAALAKWTFTIADTGDGIKPADMARLFQPFSQLEANLQNATSGSGLGLSIVRRLAEQMNGESGVRSLQGVGSEFWFSIKLETAA
jgi:signal transduction histidine kinase